MNEYHKMMIVGFALVIGLEPFILLCCNLWILMGGTV
jgi:hypothetical protein